MTHPQKLIYVAGTAYGFAVRDAAGASSESFPREAWGAAVDNFASFGRRVVFRPDLLTARLAVEYWRRGLSDAKWCRVEMRVKTRSALYYMAMLPLRDFTPALTAAWECYGGVRSYLHHPCAPAFEAAGVDLDVSGRAKEVLREVFDPTLFVDPSRPGRLNRLFRYLRLTGKDTTPAFFGVSPGPYPLCNARRFVRLVAGTWEKLCRPELGLFDDEKFFGKDYKMLSQYRAAADRQAAFYGAPAAP